MAEDKGDIEKVFNWEYGLSFTKVLEAEDGRRIIAGEASNSMQDMDGEIMDMDSLKEASDKYFQNPVIKFMHDKSPRWKGAIGKVIPEFTDSDGVIYRTSFGKTPFIVAEISKSPAVDDLWLMIKEGMFRGFSIGGQAAKKVKTFVKETGQTATRIIVKAWVETSVVDTPSASGAFFNVLKSQGGMVEEQVETEEVIEVPHPVVDTFIKTCDSIIISSLIQNITKGGQGSGSFNPCYSGSCFRMKK